MKTSTKKGFTLIELLVVIAIISLLSSIILAALSTARANARTGQREEELLTLRNALELYYDKNGHYPNTAGNIYQSDNDILNDFAGQNVGFGGWIPNLVSDGDIGALPHDPAPGVVNNSLCGPNWYGVETPVYIYESDNGTGYELGSICGSHSPISSGSPLYDSFLATAPAASNNDFPDPYSLKICVPGTSVPNNCNGGAQEIF